MSRTKQQRDYHDVLTWTDAGADQLRAVIERNLDLLAHREGDDCGYLYERECDCPEPSRLVERMRQAGVLA